MEERDWPWMVWLGRTGVRTKKIRAGPPYFHTQFQAHRPFLPGNGELLVGDKLTPPSNRVLRPPSPLGSSPSAAPHPPAFYAGSSQSTISLRTSSGRMAAVTGDTLTLFFESLSPNRTGVYCEVNLIPVEGQGRSIRRGGDHLRAQKLTVRMLQPSFSS